MASWHTERHKLARDEGQPYTRRSPFHTCRPRNYSRLMAESGLALHGTRGPVLFFPLEWHRSELWHECVSRKKMHTFGYMEIMEIICGPNRQSQYSLALQAVHHWKNADCCSTGFNMTLASFSSTRKCKLSHSVLLFSSPTERVMNTLMIGRHSAQIRSSTWMIFCASVKCFRTL